MKKTIVLICIAVFVSFAIIGCSSEQSNTASSHQQDNNIAVGDTATLATEYGDVEVIVDGFEISDDMTSLFLDNQGMSSEKKIGLLLLQVKNVSFKNTSSGPSVLLLDEMIFVNDNDGVSLTAMSQSLDYGEYEGLAGGILEISERRTKRVMLLYPVDPSLENVEVHIQDYIVDCPVTSGNRAVS